MIIDVIKDFYNGMIKMQEPVDCDSYDLPEEIKALLSQTNGIQETMSLPKTGKVYEFDPIDNESTHKADSLEEFYKSN